ncbi:MAG: hypothetical protein K0R38_2894 [Polyangiaceae bacterium]|nr:hypothetical protein [Polyangiaceae bacterium]
MTRSLLAYPRIRSWFQPKSWHAALGMLGFFPPVVGLLPRSCDPNGPGGPGSGGSSVGASAGDAGHGGSSAGDGGETPGAFDVIEPSYDVGQPADQRWITDWSGDGQTAVGVHTNPPYEDAYGAFFVSWNAARGWELQAKVRVETDVFNEPPTHLTNCDARVKVWRDGTGWITSNAGLGVPFVEPGLFHDDLVLSEDGTALTFRTGIRDQVRPWTEWHDTSGNESSLLLDTVYSLSADGLTAFGISSCYTVSCTYPKTFRWRPLEGYADISTTAPTPYVAADGETIVYNYNETHLGIWQEDSLDIIDCVDACTAIAWSSRAQVLLVNRNDDFFIWTRPHGFRRVLDLINVPAGVAVWPTGVSLDGWTITGDAFTDAPYANFRATLKADAFQ